MEVKAIYVNLPISNIQKTKIFWTNLGFTFNEKLSNDKALCLVLNQGLMYGMLLTPEMFSFYANKPLNAFGTHVITALQVNSKEEVDKLIKLALQNGATRYKEGGEHGWLYYDCFADLDGNKWEIMFVDYTKINI